MQPARLCYAENCREKEQAEEAYRSLHDILESFVRRAFRSTKEGCNIREVSALVLRWSEMREEHSYM